MVTIHQFPFIIKNNFIFTSNYNFGSQNPFDIYALQSIELIMILRRQKLSCTATCVIIKRVAQKKNKPVLDQHAYLCIMQLYKLK